MARQRHAILTPEAGIRGAVRRAFLFPAATHVACVARDVPHATDLFTILVDDVLALRVHLEPSPPKTVAEGSEDQGSG